MYQSNSTNSSNPPDQADPFDFQQVDSNLRKVILANEQIVKQQCKEIKRLQEQLQYTRQKYQLLSEQLVIITQVKSNDELSLNQALIQKIANLQKQLTSEKVKAALKQQTALKQYYINRQKVKQGKIEVYRNNVESLINVQKIKNNQQYMSRKRKNSYEQQNNTPNWLKALKIHKSWDYQQVCQEFKEKTISYVKKFIPHQLRCKVWPLLFQNKLALSDALYIELLERKIENWISPKVLDQIQKDIQRSFCGKIKIPEKVGLAAEVSEVLQLFHLYRPDISYVQGMTYPVIILVLIVGKVKAFKIFSNIILTNSFYRRLFTFSSEDITLYCRTFDYLLKEDHPQISKKLQLCGIQSQLFLIEWFYTFFSRGLSFECTLQVWDLFAYYDKVVHYKLALSVFSLISQNLKSTNYEQTVGLIRDFSYYTQQKKLMQYVLQHKLTSEKLEQAINKCRKNV